MTLRLKLLIGIALVVFAACHVAAAYKLEAGRQIPETPALRD